LIVPSLSNRRLIRRAAELGLLNDVRRNLSSGRGSVVLVGGSAGIGKTRLLNEFTRSLRGGRAPLLGLGECLQDAPRPFGPFRALLARSLAAMPDSVRGAAPATLRSLAVLLPDAAQALGLRHDPALAVEKAELFTGVLRYVESAAAKRALVFAIEDLHWADAATLELLAYLAPRIGSVRAMFVATYRDDEPAGDTSLLATIGRLEREPIVRRIALEPLPERDVQALIDEALGSSRVLDPAERRDVVARSEGNPFFIEEILKQALERQQAPQGPLPVSIRALILERVARARPGDRELLEHAAVLGQEFDLETLATIAGRSPTGVREALRRLRDLNLIVEEHATGSRFAFRHGLTRQSVYDELLAADTRALHGRIAATLAARESDAGVDELAYHAWKSGASDATARHSERAGDRALELRAAHEAATYYERALEAVPAAEDRIRLLHKCGEAYVHAGDFAKAAAACTAEYAMLRARGDVDAAIFALTRGAAEYSNGGEIRRALDLLEECARDDGLHASQPVADHLYASLGRIATAGGDFERARAALARVRDPQALAAFSHQVYWLARLFCAEAAHDRDGWREAVAALRRRNHEVSLLLGSQMLHSIASSAIPFAENAEAERAASEALEIDREHGFARAFAFASAVKASSLAVTGRLAEARDAIVDALSEPDIYPVRAMLAAGASPAALALADDALAARCLDAEALRAVGDTGLDASFNLASGMRAAYLFGAGRVAEAQALLDLAVDGAQHPFAVIHFWPFAARFVDETRFRRIRERCAEMQRSGDERVAPACLALLDAIGARRFDARDGTASAALAARRYHELGWPLLEAQAHEAAGDRDAALALYRASGSIADVRRLDSTVRRIGPGATKRSLLSPRERQVADFVARGLSNRAIATELGVGEKTVEKYISAIFAKLRFSTRAQLAAHVARGESAG
jgi:DNA-binding CsgD family transcriptional regulator/tetratricopeptide (TPR) repeat protein